MAGEAENLLDDPQSLPVSPAFVPLPRQSALDSIASAQDAHREALRRWGMPSAAAQIPGILQGAAEMLAAPLVIGARAMQGAASGQLSQEEMVRQTVDAALATVGGGAFGAERGAIGVAGGRLRGPVPSAYHLANLSQGDREILNDLHNLGYVDDNLRVVPGTQRQDILPMEHRVLASIGAWPADWPELAPSRTQATPTTRPAPSLSPSFSRFEAERGASGAPRLTEPPQSIDEALRQMGRDRMAAVASDIAPQDVSPRAYDVGLISGETPKAEHQVGMEAHGIPRSAPGEELRDAQAREFLRGRLGFVPAGEPQAWARMHGWSGQPGQGEPAVGPLGGNAAARAAFTRHIAPHMEESDFADKYFAGMHNPDISMARLYGYGSRGEGLSFDGPLRMGDKNVGQITRTIYPEVGEAKHSYLALDPSLQGSDIGKRLLANQVALYNRMGMKKVSLTANIDVGGYAWAKYGFLPDQDDWEELTSMLRGRLNGMNVPSEVAQPLRQILRSDDPRSMWSLADVKAGGGIGKQLLLGQNWHGSLDLKDPASMKRFTDYVLPKPKPTQ